MLKRRPFLDFLRCFWRWTRGRQNLSPAQITSLTCRVAGKFTSEPCFPLDMSVQQFDTSVRQVAIGAQEQLRSIRAPMSLQKGNKSAMPTCDSPGLTKPGNRKSVYAKPQVDTEKAFDPRPLLVGRRRRQRTSTRLCRETMPRSLCPRGGLAAIPARPMGWPIRRTRPRRKQLRTRPGRNLRSKPQSSL